MQERVVGEMIFLFDVDGVCADLVTLMLSDLNRKFPKLNLKMEDITNHDFLSSKGLILSEEPLKFIRNRLTTADYALKAKPIAESLAIISKLKADGHIVKWVTAPYYSSKTWCFDRLEWLRNIYGAVAADVYFAEDKSLVFGDVFVDDKIENVIAWSKQWKDGTAVLFAQPWNASYVGPLIRGNWATIAKLGVT